jgi:hypothetical protein
MLPAKPLAALTETAMRTAVAALSTRAAAGLAALVEWER